MSEPASSDHQPKAEAVPAILDSWKGIASHFGVTVRTVQLWEQESGMPVHRQPGRRGRVFAYVSELEAWRAPARNAQPAGAAPRSWLRIAVPAGIALLLLVTAAVLLLVRDAAGAPAHHRLDGRILVVLDEKGAEVFRYLLLAAPSIQRGAPSEWIPPVIADLDGDGSPEFLYSYQRYDSSSSDELLCFSASGQSLWTFVPGRRVATSTQVFPNLYRIRSVTLLPDEKTRQRRVLVNAIQVPDYPTQIVTLDAKGRIGDEYWHSGHLVKSLIADLDSDGSAEILFAGIVNGSMTTDLVVLASAGFSGASAEENPAYQLQNMPAPGERARLLFPRTKLSRFLDHYTIPSALLYKDSFLRYHTDDYAGTAVGISIGYVFTSDLRLARVEPGDGAVAAYNEMKARRILPADFVPDTLEALSAVRSVTPFAPRSPQLAKVRP